MKRNRFVVERVMMIVMVLVVFEFDMKDFFKVDIMLSIIINELVSEFEVVIERGLVKI